MNANGSGSKSIRTSMAVYVDIYIHAYVQYDNFSGEHHLKSLSHMVYLNGLRWFLMISVELFQK